jgi:membrane-bound lytic murein transglycosylase A
MTAASFRAARAFAAGLVAAAFLAGGCKPKQGPFVEGIPGLKDYERQVDGYALRKLKLEEYPDFASAFASPAGLREAIQRSLNYLGKSSSRQFYPFAASDTDKITHQQQVDTLSAMLRMLDSGMSGAQANAEIRQKFDVYTSVGWNGQGEVLFTGYYTPIFDASPAPTSKFRYPLYKSPPDLEKGFDGKILGRKTAGGVVPYPARQQIEQSNMLAGTELYWVGDAFEAYIIHVQGSARLRMPDGKLITVGYAANNGHDYNSVGKELVRDGKLHQSQLSLRGMIDYFKAHPEEVQTYTWKNPRYVFFQPSQDDSPRGSLNEPVTKLRSVATDKSIFPRASLTFLDMKLPVRVDGVIEARPYTGFACDQDTGGAIRAPGRCDVYMGVGDENGELAGRTYEEGRLYYLFLKPEFGAVAAGRSPGDSAPAAQPRGAAPLVPVAPPPAPSPR